MNREELVSMGLEIEKISEFAVLCDKYEDWKSKVLQYTYDD